MRETVKTRFQLKTKVMFILTMMMMVLAIGMTTIVSHAEEGKVTATSVKIRASADTNSEMIGGALQGDILTITGEVADADGVHTWYQVTFEGTRTGYVRSDLMQKVSGGSTGTSTPNTSTANPSTVTGEVTALQPVSAKVTGEQVRVRSNASTSGSIVSTVQRDAVLTVVGMATDSEQKTWYQVNFNDASGQLSGFVREDFISLEGEIVPADQVPVDPEPEVPDPVEPVTTPEPEPVHKDYETQQYDGVWNLMDYTKDPAVRYPIEELFNAGEQNKKLYEEAEAKLKSTKIIMIILVVLVVVLALATTLLFFKVRDMMDAAYFEEVEKETMRNRQGQRSSGKASMPTVGAGGRSSGGTQQRSSGGSQSRPSGSGQPRPSGSGSQRPSDGGQPRPSGSGSQRPSGSGQSRPSGSGAQRPSGSGQPRPAGSGQQARPSGGQTHSGGQTSRSADPQSRQVSRDGQNPSKQSKNFMADDDEFDFEYLNWDGEEDN